MFIQLSVNRSFSLYCPLKIAMNFSSQSFLLSLTTVTYESASCKIYSNSKFPGGLQGGSHACYKARPLAENATLTGDFALFHAGRSERSWGLNGAFYLLAPQLEWRLSLGEQLPNGRLSSQRSDSAPAANALPRDGGFSKALVFKDISFWPASPESCLDSASANCSFAILIGLVASDDISIFLYLYIYISI